MTITRNGRWGIVAVVAVALVAAGAAFAATQFHGSNTATGRGPGAFGGTMQGGPAFTPDGRGDRGFAFRGPGGDLSAAASYLGLGESDLFTQLQSGKTLAQIANATSGKSAAGLIDAMVSAQTAQIAAAVKSGMLTQSTADRITADLKARVTERVNGTFGRFGRAPATPPTHI
jgi:hypothetical protein